MFFSCRKFHTGLAQMRGLKPTYIIEILDPSRFSECYGLSYYKLLFSDVQDAIDYREELIAKGYSEVLRCHWPAGCDWRDEIRDSLRIRSIKVSVTEKFVWNRNECVTKYCVRTYDSTTDNCSGYKFWSFDTPEQALEKVDELLALGYCYEGIIADDEYPFEFDAYN